MNGGKSFAGARYFVNIRAFTLEDKSASTDVAVYEDGFLRTLDGEA